MQVPVAHRQEHLLHTQVDMTDRVVDQLMQVEGGLVLISILCATRSGMGVHIMSIDGFVYEFVQVLGLHYNL